MKLKRKIQIALAVAAAAACFAAGRASSGNCKTVLNKKTISHKEPEPVKSEKMKTVPVMKTVSASKSSPETSSKASQDLSELIRILEELKIQNAEIAEKLSAAVASQRERTAETQKEASPSAPVKSEPPESGSPKEPEPSEEELFIGNSQSRTFHRQECRYGMNTASAHRVTFPSAASAVSQGYKSCRRCRPAE